MRVFATYNIKGGVGKTATAVNLAYLAAKDGARTLIWDLDPQAAATFYFRVRAKVKGGAKKLLKETLSLCRNAEHPPRRPLPFLFFSRLHPALLFHLPQDVVRRSLLKIEKEAQMGVQEFGELVPVHFPLPE